MTNQTAVRFGYPETLIREYEHWLVLLREPQATLGSLVLCAKSGATEFSALPMEAYVEMGTVVKKGQTLCILEAMKLMNEVDCDFNGKVVDILVENGQPVEYGEPLFKIEVSK